MQPDINIVIDQMIQNCIHGCIADIKLGLKNQIILENKPFLTVEDFSTITGLQKTTIYKYCNEGKIGYYRPTGKHTYFTWDSIREFVLNEQCYSKSNSEIRRLVQSEIVSKKLNFRNQQGKI